MSYMLMQATHFIITSIICAIIVLSRAFVILFIVVPSRAFIILFIVEPNRAFNILFRCAYLEMSVSKLLRCVRY